MHLPWTRRGGLHSIPLCLAQLIKHLMNTMIAQASNAIFRESIQRSTLAAAYSSPILPVTVVVGRRTGAQKT